MDIDALLLQIDCFYPNTDNLAALKTITIRKILAETRVFQAGGTALG